IRTGHIPLNGYLYRFKRVDAVRCPTCGYHTENTDHFIFYCPAYAHEHWALRRHLKSGGLTRKAVLNDARMIKPLANYIAATHRF
ncbi:hypothetical protein BC834DRAFT_791325, partial [Gloeopeniophorella convolvens]